MQKAAKRTCLRTILLGLASPMILAAAPLQVLAAAPGADASGAAPWMNTKLSADARASLVVQAMTQDEKLKLVRGYSGVSPRMLPKELQFGDQKIDPEVDAFLRGTSGFVRGVPRLGIPDLHETDASLGVTNGFAGLAVRPGDEATALPSGPTQSSTWNPALVEAAGALVGQETRAHGFNVLLGPGFNLARDPRSGRNFEYLGGEDPWLAGVLAGAAIKGLQSAKIIATAKHYVMYDQSHAAEAMNAKASEKTMRESDLLAFQIAIEQGDPGSVMCAYNKVNGQPACESDMLQNKILKGEWGWKGFIMSDWGAVHSTAPSANAGLDQDSAYTFDKGGDWFGAPLRDAVARGQVPQARLDDMARRIVRSMFANGLVDDPVQPGGAIDRQAHAQTTQRIAEEGLILLRNQKGVLPLKASAKSIVVIGGHADVGVLSGGGSSQVIPYGGSIVFGTGVIDRQIYHPSSPLKALRADLPGARITYLDGTDQAAAVAAAKAADVAIVFGVRHASEGMDHEGMNLPDNQDGLISAVAAARPGTIVVLQTDNPVAMPWLEQVGAVVQAWYPGQRGGEAIAAILSGKVNPSGKTPITFPRSEAQLPRPVMSRTPTKETGFGGPPPAPFTIDYDIEGSDIGYRWLARSRAKPLFPFGYGLSYTTYAYGGLRLQGGKTVTATFTVKNSGRRAGKEVAQLYLVGAPGQPKRKRLLGFSKVELAPGQTKTVTLKVDPRLLADYDTKARGWSVRGGAYKIAAGASSEDLGLVGVTPIEARLIQP